MAMFLTTEELEELTGKVRPSAQFRALIDMGYYPDRRADGVPVLARQAVLERQMETTPQRAPVEPDFEALERVLKQSAAKRRGKKQQ